MEYKHHDSRINLVRHHDRIVFGKVRACTSVSRKAYRIADGEVQVKIKSGWHNVIEIDQKNTQYAFEISESIAKDTGVFYGVMGCVVIDW